MSEWRMSACLFHPNGRDLLIGDTKGLLRYQPQFPSRNQLRFGTPDIIDPQPGWQALDVSPDGRFFAAFNVRTRQASVFDHTLTNRLAVFDAPTNTSFVTISPDGKWLVACSRGAEGVKLWDVAGQKLLRATPASILPRCAFSADGRWLAVTDDKTFELLKTGSWKPAPPLLPDEPHSILGAAAFSPDGRWLALVVNRFSVHLFDLKDFAPLGVLRSPGTVQIQALAFSADGSRLAAVGAEARVAVWHLNELRERLSEFDLSWDSRPPKSVSE
jgi:WD40 repeat protein